MNSLVHAMETNSKKFRTQKRYRVVNKSIADNKFGEFTLPLRISNMNIIQTMHTFNLGYAHLIEWVS
jgi:hypothetical protein